jgi:hypothetical protein
LNLEFTGNLNNVRFVHLKQDILIRASML